MTASTQDRCHFCRHTIEKFNAKEHKLIEVLPNEWAVAHADCLLRAEAERRMFS